MEPSIFSTKCHGLPNWKWALDLSTRWPHYQMTFENPFCSGLKATHSVWAISWGLDIVWYSDIFQWLTWSFTSHFHSDFVPRFCPASAAFHSPPAVRAWRTDWKGSSDAAGAMELFPSHVGHPKSSKLLDHLSIELHGIADLLCKHNPYIAPDTRWLMTWFKTSGIIRSI